RCPNTAASANTGNPSGEYVLASAGISSTSCFTRSSRPSAAASCSSSGTPQARRTSQSSLLPLYAVSNKADCPFALRAPASSGSAASILLAAAVSLVWMSGNDVAGTRRHELGNFADGEQGRLTSHFRGQRDLCAVLDGLHSKEGSEQIRAARDGAMIGKKARVVVRHKRLDGLAQFLGSRR